MSIKQVAEAWSKLGSNYASSQTHRQGASLAKLIALARPQANDICLDIGTGTGHTAAQLAKHATKVYGLDPSAGMRQAGEALYADVKNLHFVDGTSEKTGFPNSSFDIVSARHTLHHHPSMPRTLQEIKRVLKAGGRLVIVDEITPNEAVDAWYHQLEVTRDPTHQRAYSMAAWRTFIAEAGLSWICGDVETSYALEVEAWIMRMNPNPEQAERVHQLFREADETARSCFQIRYDGNNATHFDMPMALILAVKEEDAV